MAGRDNFTPATKRKIAERAGYFCSYPGCGRLTVGPSSDRVSGVTMTGVAAHIAAAAAGGQRADATITTAERKAESNGIWMCAIHGKWIDDNPSAATVEKLLTWKQAHEAEISAWVEHGHPGIFRSWDRLAAITRDQRDTIETRLPNGHTLTRDASPMLAALDDTGACLVTGESGVGKSALVKAVLDKNYADARQVWLGPEALRSALSEAERGQIGLTAPLGDLLQTSSAARNFLVLDAVERADGATIARLTQLVTQIAGNRQAGGGWQVIAIGQQAGFEVHLDPLVAALNGRMITVGAIEPEQVQEALLSVPALAQHAQDEAFIALLGNLRTLGWIMAAGHLFAGAETGQMAARSQIADRLWAYWTGGDPDLHSFMIRLAQRDAEYERSFGLSDFSQDDRSAWKAGKQRVPLKLSDRNRLSFEHDLASDWARYEYLKEIADDVNRWAALADRPLWVAGLRLFGQFLLREPDQARGGWDSAFAAANAASAPNAIDVLLDALCLDPLADQFLSARRSLLFADKGKLLDRLITRFMHIATLPDRASSSTQDPGVSLYAEAEMRSPVWRNWPPLIRFLVEHRNAVAAFGSTAVSKICELWLTKTPVRIGDRGVLGRTGMAELALETARVRQIENIAHGLYGGRSDDASTVYTAALAGAEDQPEAVIEFALEMARRKPLSKATQAKVDTLRKKANRRTQRRRAAQEPEFESHGEMLGYRKLPPWPMGPSGRLEDGFRKAVTRNNGLHALIRFAPEVAAEILLACIVEDNPHTEPGGMRIDPRLGLDYDHDDRPTIHWNSPFLPFLLNAPEAALDALLRLLDFCTERWADDAGDAPPSVSLTLADGTSKAFAGDWQVLDWSHARRSSNAQLFSSLDALERWLWLKINAGEDVSALCASLFERSRSAAILGILADCAKQRPQLLQGSLAPLLTSPVLILAEAYRLGRRMGSDGFAWYRAGDALRRIGAEWEQAPHRLASLKQVIRNLRRAEPDFDAQALEAFAAWPNPEPDFTLRQRALLAEVDPSNWREERDAEGKPAWTFSYPAEIAAEIEALEPTPPDRPSLAMVVRQLEGMLSAPLSDGDASEIYAELDDAEGLAIFEPPERDFIETAIAGLLIARAGDWCAAKPAVAERLIRALERSVPGTEADEAPADDQLEYGPALAWACMAAVNAKARGLGEGARWDRILSYGLATGDAGIVRTIITAARQMRKDLGAAYDAIVEAGVFGAALNALRPRMEGDPGSPEIAAHWRRRLARRPLAERSCPIAFDLVALAERVDRLWQSRFRREFGTDTHARHWRGRRRRFSLGISTYIVTALFDWALQQDVVPTVQERAEHYRVIRMLWDFAEWQLRGDPDEERSDDDGYGLLDEFGLNIIRTIAARIPLGGVAKGRSLWEPVLALGPRGEFTLEHLIDCYFLRLYKDVDPAHFISNWDAMLAFVFAPGWAKGGRWWKGRSILRHALGLDASHQIANCPKVMAHVANLAPYYERFAAEHIAFDDSVFAAFAYFVASQAGAALRLSAIRWIEAALDQDNSALRNNAASALADLVRVMLEEHSAGLIADQLARQSLTNVIARMVRDQVPYALTLQDRARALR